MNPDLLIWAGALVAAVIGFALATWLSKPTPWGATGAGVGLVTFLLALGILMYIPLFFGPAIGHHEPHPELVGRMGFNGTWDNATITTQLEDAGYEIGANRADLVSATGHTDNGTTYTFTLEPTPESGNTTDLRLRGHYTPTEDIASDQAAQDWIETHRDPLRDHFDQAGTDLAQELDWQRTWGPTWASIFAV